MKRRHQWQSKKKASAPLARLDEISEAITMMMALDLQPFSFVHDRGFRRLLSLLAPGYCIPNRSYFTLTGIPKMYNEVKAEKKKEVLQAMYFALTTDTWTSRAN